MNKLTTRLLDQACDSSRRILLNAGKKVGCISLARNHIGQAPGWHESGMMVSCSLNTQEGYAREVRHHL